MTNIKEQFVSDVLETLSGDSVLIGDDIMQGTSVSNLIDCLRFKGWKNISNRDRLSDELKAQGFVVRPGRASQNTSKGRGFGRTGTVVTV